MAYINMSLYCYNEYQPPPPITREDFNRLVDISGIDTAILFKTSIEILLNKRNTIIDIDDLIEYASMRYQLQEFPKVIYYCYFGLLEIFRTQLQLNKKTKLLTTITSSIDQLVIVGENNEQTTHKLIEGKQINVLNNADPVIKILKSVQINTITLMSFSARKMSSMERIDQGIENEILKKFNTLYQNNEYEKALHEIYFLFSNSFLKESPIYRNDLLILFKNFCNNWIREI